MEYKKIMEERIKKEQLRQVKTDENRNGQAKMVAGECVCMHVYVQIFVFKSYRMTVVQSILQSGWSKLKPHRYFPFSREHLSGVEWINCSRKPCLPRL